MNSLEYAIVKVSACGIFAEPTFKSEMVNQALIKEKVIIIDKKDNWYKAYLNHDKYEGWIHEMYLDISSKNNQDLIDETYYIERFSKIPVESKRKRETLVSINNFSILFVSPLSISTPVS